MKEKIIPFYEPADLDVVDGLTFKPYQPVKHGEPVLTGDLPDEDGGVHLTGTVMLDPLSGKFRMWYSCTKPSTYARYAESDDGIQWEKPNVAEARWVDPTCRNAVMEGKCPVVIVDEEADDPMDRYRMFIWHGRMDLFRSKDGYVWERHPARWNPVWPLEAGEGLGEVPVPFWDPVRREYIAMARIWTGPRPKGHERSWDPKHKEYAKPSSGSLRMVGRGSSPDGIFWTGPDIIYNCDNLDPLGSQPYKCAAWRYGDRHIGLIQIIHDIRHPDESLQNTLRLYLAWSTDGCYTWNRLHDRLHEFIPLGVDGSWDGGMISQSSRFTEVGDEWRCYYSGHKQRHVISDGDFNGISFATMPKGRLIGVTADAFGSAVTRSILPGDGELWVNADGRGGTIRVTILDGDGNAPQGPSDPVDSDGVRTQVTWNGVPWNGRDSKSVQLRFDLECGAHLWECGWGM